MSVYVLMYPLWFFVCQVDDFLQALVSYDKEHIPESCLTVVKQEYLRNPEFHPDLVRTKSTAAAGLCAWTINIVRYYEVRQCLQIVCSFNNCQYIFLYSLQKGLFFSVKLLFLYKVRLLFSQIYCEVIPKRHALSQANAELEMATTKLLAVQRKLVVSAMLLLYNVIIKSLLV